MICEFGDVVVVPFPFLERPISKRRPALVFSSREFNEENRHSILAMITTGANSSLPSDYRIVDLAATGLPHSSIIRMKLFTLPNDLFLRRLGALATSERTGIGRAIRSIVGR